MKVHTTRSGAELFLAGLGICIVVAGFYALGFEAGSRNRGEQDALKFADAEQRIFVENQGLQFGLDRDQHLLNWWKKEAASFAHELIADKREIDLLRKQRAILPPYMKSGELVIEGRKP